MGALFATGTRNMTGTVHAAPDVDAGPIAARTERGAR